MSATQAELRLSLARINLAARKARDILNGRMAHDRHCTGTIALGTCTCAAGLLAEYLDAIRAEAKRGGGS